MELFSTESELFNMKGYHVVKRCKCIITSKEKGIFYLQMSTFTDPFTSTISSEENTAMNVFGPLLDVSFLGLTVIV